MVSRQNLEGITLMMLHGCDANGALSVGISAMHMAALAGNVELISLLLEYGANPNAVDDLFVSPLHFAAYAQRLTAVERLLAAPGVDVNLCDSNGQSILTVAIRRRALARLETKSLPVASIN
jgi:serine/threonine-protein kinase TNNI3K